MRNIVILGITGSIGTTALRGCTLFNNKIRIVGATCNSRLHEALELCTQHGIPNLCITGKCLDRSQEDSFAAQNGIRIWTDVSEMLSFLRPHTILNGIAGSPGLKASFQAMESCPSSTLALANKESVVLGGQVLFKRAEATGCRIIPVDSEHSAIDELIQAHGHEGISKLVITASGGPFRNLPLEELDEITPAQAVKHPTWKMGPKISIDSSTLANKGLEVIEAHYLFGFCASDIEVVIHPQSVVHSMVRTTSGQVYAQMSPPDMVFPIMRALMWPRVDRQAGSALDFTELDLTFRKLDTSRFPFVADAFECVRLEGAYPIAYNAANEVAVQAFIEEKIRYTDIRNVVRQVLDLDWTAGATTLDDVLSLQETAFSKANAAVRNVAESCRGM